MKDIIRDSTVGQILRLITQNRILKYPEEEPKFQCPHSYANGQIHEDRCDLKDAGTMSSLSSENETLTKELNEPVIANSATDLETGRVFPALAKIPTLEDLEHRYSASGEAERKISRPIVPVKTSDGTILVGWYTTGK